MKDMNGDLLKEPVPIITANYNPLRFIMRNELDVWTPTLEEINKRSYDYVKLHRSSFAIDIGIAPFSMGVCFDGTLYLPAFSKYNNYVHALEQFNGVLTELLLGGVYCEAVTPNDIGCGSLLPTAFTRMNGGSKGSAASFHMAARNKYIGSLDGARLLHPEIISVKEMQSALNRGKKLLSLLGNIPREQVLYGATFYVLKQWAESLIHIWTITERVVEIAWQKHVVGLKQATKKRKAFLDDHRTWPISAKLEVLFQKNLLPPLTYEKLDEVRKARNNFAHRGVLPTHEMATLALSGCFELASLCSSDFKKIDLFEHVVELVTARCNPVLYPKKTKFKESELSCWLPLHPLPGEKAWGDKEYEIVEDLCPRPFKKNES